MGARGRRRGPRAARAPVRRLAPAPHHRFVDDALAPPLTSLGYPSFAGCSFCDSDGYHTLFALDDKARLRRGRLGDAKRSGKTFAAGYAGGRQRSASSRTSRGYQTVDTDTRVREAPG